MSRHEMTIQSEDDIYFALYYVRVLMNQLSFSAIEQQKVLVSVAELTRNLLDHANGIGTFSCEITDQGIRFMVIDNGPGIPDLNEVLNGKKTPSSRGLGLGLSGAKRLMDELHIETSREGTKIVGIQRKKKKRMISLYSASTN
jgi:serine/threonine-protein kinase RsbT